jgi:hypothetical protein
MGSLCHPAKHIPGCVSELEKTLEAVYQKWRGVLWRRQVWLSCVWSNKLKTKKFDFFMDCPHILVDRYHTFLEPAVLISSPKGSKLHNHYDEILYITKFLSCCFGRRIFTPHGFAISPIPSVGQVA